MLRSFLFFKSFMNNPKTIGSIIPSSDKLGSYIASDIYRQVGDGVIVDVGAGTGAITKHLIKKFGISNVIAYECDEKLCEILRKRFKGLTVIQDNADQIDVLMKNYKVKSVVCGIPLTTISPILRELIERSIQRLLDNNGIYCNYTYRKKSAYHAVSGFKIEKVHKVFMNLPPAYVCFRRKLISDK